MDVFPQGDVLTEKCGKVLLRKPVRTPALDDTQAKAVGMCLLTQCSSSRVSIYSALALQCSKLLGIRRTGGDRFDR